MLRRVSVGIVALGLVSCATTADLRKIGLTERDVLHLESENWTQWVSIDHLDPATRPIRVRELRCKPDKNFRNTYWCDYALDYGSKGSVSGTLQRRDFTIARDAHGQWAFVIIVT